MKTLRPPQGFRTGNRHLVHGAGSRKKMSIHSKLRDYYTLTKPEVNLLILMTTSTGYWVAYRGVFHPAGLINTLLGTLLVASGTATLNQWMERVWDAQMRRTVNRPLPAGRVTAREALVFGVSLSILGGLYLLATTNWLTAALAISTLLSYLLIYTPLKRTTPLCTLLGAFPGAMPVLIGWTGASVKINAEAWLLFGILFLWQFPHFLAITLMYREDYARAGYKMLPDFDADGRFTRGEIVGVSLLLVLMTMLMERSQLMGLGIVSLAGLVFLCCVVQLSKATSRRVSAGVLHASVLYLPVVLFVAAVFRS